MKKIFVLQLHLFLKAFKYLNYNIYTKSLIMTYRQCRNFTEMLRALNYPRLVSVQNFKKPNFELVAQILYWLAHRYDPQTQISDNIDQERDRVEFIKSITNLFSVKARIKLNPKKLYQADNNSVQEMLKITTVLYKAHNSSAIQQQQVQSFSLSAKISNLKAHKILANEICDLGAKLYDSLSKQPDLKKKRQQALSFLDNMGRSSDSQQDQAYIQKCVGQIIKQQDQSAAQLNKYVSNMEKQQRSLEQKIKKKSGELERAQKRYKNLINVKPAFMDQYERLEVQLQRLYQVYVQKYRNLDYLENQLDLYNKIQEQKFQNSQKALKKMQAKIKQDQMRQIRGEDEIDQAMLAAQLQQNEQNRGISRGNSRNKGQRGQEKQQQTKQFNKQPQNQPTKPQQQNKRPSGQSQQPPQQPPQKNQPPPKQQEPSQEDEQQSGEELQDDEESQSGDDNF